ncbi:MAG: FeoA domain-containing protein [Methanoregulaceae archaeon]|nr:FeoA domain-containing protein [Methanoregulaceae archaeon]
MIWRFHSDRGNGPFAEDIAAILGEKTSDVSPFLRTLTEDEYITISVEGRINLTKAGAELGRNVVRRHDVLKCFFTEILGMEPGSASDEACILEHGVSDEVIDRLGNYLNREPLSETASPGQVILSECVEGETLEVRGVKSEEGLRRLSDLGVVPGVRILLRRRLRNHAVVVQVKGCDIALSPEVASSVVVERIPG